MSYLTERQRQVLGFVTDTLRRRGVAPTLREIAEHFGFASTATAQKHVRLLVEKGFLTRARHQKRGLVPVTSADVDNVVDLPLLGTVAAGSPVESFAAEERVAVPADLVAGGDHYVLRVRGDSMVDDGILDGDAVIIQARAAARDGETVVALIDGEATLKRLYRGDGGMVRLQPANPAVAPLKVAAARVRVQGVVVGLIRRYA